MAPLSTQDRDSGVYLPDDEECSPPSRPMSLSDESRLQPCPSFLSLKPAPSTKSPSAPQPTDSITRRIRRPAELNISPNTISHAPKRRSELELRHELIRNSCTQSKAALRSPTQLLKERMNMSPKKTKHIEETRHFTPPRPMENGCLLPGTGASIGAFTSTSVRARSEASNRPAWWCQADKLVVFDSMSIDDDGEPIFHTRTSKGLSIARRRGDLETIIIPMDCAHCQEMLNRYEWKYEMRVCKRNVCWDCRERCKWELAEEERGSGDGTEGLRIEVSRDRADSVLQDEQVRDEAFMQKMGIEQSLQKSSMAGLGGIEERLGAQLM